MQVFCSMFKLKEDITVCIFSKYLKDSTCSKICGNHKTFEAMSIDIKEMRLKNTRTLLVQIATYANHKA